MSQDSTPPAPNEFPAVPAPPPPPLPAGDPAAGLVLPTEGDLQPPPLPEPVPPVWPALLIGPLAIATAIVVGGIFSVVAIALSGDMRAAISGADFAKTMEMLNERMARLFETPLGALLLILPGQAVFLGGAIAATALSPVPWKKRLGFTRSRLPVWTWPILALGTFFIASAAGMAVEAAFPQNLQQLEFFNDIAKAGGTNIAIFNGLMLSLMPGFGEETMFRGYIQTRLLQRWPALAAIAFTSLIFAIAHFDPVHILAVLPLGFWLGVIAWRAGSVFPGMFCHAAMNGLSMIGGRFSEGGRTEWNAATFAFLGLTGFALILSIRIVSRHGRRGEQRATAR